MRHEDYCGRGGKERAPPHTPHPPHHNFPAAVRHDAGRDGGGNGGGGTGGARVWQVLKTYELQGGEAPEPLSAWPHCLVSNGRYVIRAVVPPGGGRRVADSEPGTL